MTAHLSIAEARALGLQTEKRSKYGNTKVLADGKKFDSKAEYLRYLWLKDELKAGYISGLKCQPSFMLQEPFKHAGKTERAITYKADFIYQRDGQTIVEDVKGSCAR